MHLEYGQDLELYGPLFTNETEFVLNLKSIKQPIQCIYKLMSQKYLRWKKYVL